MRAEGAITQLLQARAAGDGQAESRLMALIYDELHRIAALHMRAERAGHSLTPTALIHEAWIRLANEGAAQPAADRVQFYALAARRMRQVLIDHARRRDADKRGAGLAPLSLSRAADQAAEAPVEAMALEQALQQLEAHDPRKAQVVELRWYGGLEMSEIAALLGISRATAQRDWEVARAFLHLQLQ